MAADLPAARIPAPAAMSWADMLIAPGAALAGVVITMVYSGRRDRIEDARRRRDARRLRLAESYNVMLHAAVGTSDLLRQIEAIGLTPSAERLAGWNAQVAAITSELNNAQIRLMLDETEPEVTNVLGLGLQIGKIWGSLGPGESKKPDPAVLVRQVKDAHAQVHPLAERMRVTIRQHLARLEKPLPEPWLVRIERRFRPKDRPVT